MRYVTDYLTTKAGEVLRAHGITTVRVRLQETETSYAEHEQRVEATASAAA